MGRIHRCSDSGTEQPGQTDCLYSVGSSGTEKKRMLTNPKHLILKAPHPSPLAAYRGFFGSKPFSQDKCISGEEWNRAD